jgi:hypothetical protein
MPSNDPVRRAKQLENLRPTGAVSHGATSEGKLKPLRAEHRAALLQRFSQLDEHRLGLLSDLLARIDLGSEFVDVHGLMRNTRQPHPVLELLTRWERRAWDMLSQLAAKGPGARECDRETSMLQIELTADERIGLMAADSKTRTDVAHRLLVRLSAERERGRATSLRHTSLTAQAHGRPPEKLNLRDLTDADLAKLEELTEQAEAAVNAKAK